MATIGLPSLAESVKVFRMENDDHEIEIAGLVFNHASYSQERPEVQRSITEIRELAEEHGWHIFSNRIRYSASYATAARTGTPLARTTHARYTVIEEFEEIKDEIFHKIGIGGETP